MVAPQHLLSLLMISFVLLSAFLVGAKVELSLPLFCMVSFCVCF